MDADTLRLVLVEPENDTPQLLFADLQDCRLVSAAELCHAASDRRFERGLRGFNVVALLLVATAVPALAADDPLTVVNNLSDFIFSLIRAIGLILLGFGILQVGLSLKSHDPSQRANGMLTVAGGIVITFTKEILSLITG